MAVYILPLHHNKCYVDECVKLLNEEWTRSLGARKHSLEQSNDDFPYSFVLIERNPPVKDAVIGHSRLVRVQGDPTACFVQSVIVSKQRRGEGLGRVLMQQTEEYAHKKLGICTIYLTTHDKQDFYCHIGYSYCEPVIFNSSKLNLENLWQNASGSSANSMDGNFSKNTSSTTMRTEQNDEVDQAMNCDNNICNFTVKSSKNSGLVDKMNKLKMDVDTEGVHMTTCTDENINSTTEVMDDSSELSPPPPPPFRKPTTYSHSRKPFWDKNQTAKKVDGDVYWMKKYLG